MGRECGIHIVVSKGAAYPEDVLAEPLHHDGVGAMLPRLAVLGRFAVQTDVIFLILKKLGYV
jgi:limonene-1,2-epoxide hydrolase